MFQLMISSSSAIRFFSLSFFWYNVCRWRKLHFLYCKFGIKIDFIFIVFKSLNKVAINDIGNWFWNFKNYWILKLFELKFWIETFFHVFLVEFFQLYFDFKLFWLRTKTMCPFSIQFVKVKHNRTAERSYVKIKLGEILFSCRNCLQSKKTTPLLNIFWPTLSIQHENDNSHRS